MTQNIALCTILAAVAVIGTDARSYGHIVAPRRGGYRYSRPTPRDASIDLVSEIFSIPLYINSLMQQHGESPVNHLAQSSSPQHYNVWEDPETGVIELTMELPGVSPEDLRIELEDDRLLRISGSRSFKRGGGVVESEFDQSFRMHEDADTDRLSVNLTNGILTIQAPKKEKKIRQIPVSPGEKLTLDVKKVNNAAVEEKESEAVAVDARADVAKEDADGFSVTEE